MNTPTKTPINTSERLFDLVRYMRAELHEEELISDEEYGWLCAGPMAVSPRGGSPSRQRLEEYDEMKARIIALETAAQGLRDATVAYFDSERSFDGVLIAKAGAKYREALARFDALKEGK